MTRKIRDELYGKNKKLSLDEFTDKLISEAHKSELWKNYKKQPVK